MKSQYDLKAWASETSRGRQLFNHNFRMSGRELAGWQLLKAVPMHRDRSLAETTYLWQSKEAPDRQVVRVSVAELHDWRAAQKHLRDALAHCMRPDLPRGSGGLAEVGDVEFVARAAPSDVPAAMQFARGNVAVAVNSVGSVTVDVSDVAAGVDRALADAPAKVASPRTMAKRLTPKTVTVKRREGVHLVKDLSKVGDRWLKAIVPDGELRRRGNALVYTSPEPGKKTVQLYSIRGATAEKMR
jgi:hypothetical protein